MTYDNSYTMTRLLTDTMLGRLTTYLRMCGYDTVYAPDVDVEADDEIHALASEESRRLLTRDRELASRTEHAVLLESRAIEDQLRELHDEGYELTLPETPEHCGTCNGDLERVSQEATIPAYAPDPHTVDVWRCRQCGQHFWKGSHWDDVAETLSVVTT